MALTVISAKYPPHIDPAHTPLAYGDRALPRLVCIRYFLILILISDITDMYQLFSSDTFLLDFPQGTNKDIRICPKGTPRLKHVVHKLKFISLDGH